MAKTNLRVAFQDATPRRRQRSREFSETVIFPFFSVLELLSLLLLTFPRERFIHFHSRANPTGTRGNSLMLAPELIADAATTLHLATVATWRFVRITYNGNSLIKTKRSAKPDCRAPGYSPRRLLVVVN